MSNDYLSTFPTHEIASRIAAAARQMGFKVSRSAAGPESRSTYVYCDKIKIRVADHPTKKMPDIDVHIDEPRPGSTTCAQAIEWLRGRK